MVPDESLAAFRQYISRVFSMNISDPNEGVALAEEGIGAVGAYAAGRITWQEFVARCETLLANAE